MLQEIRSKLQLTSPRSKRSQSDCEFVIIRADFLPYDAMRATYAVEWALKTGRLPGNVAMAIRAMSAWRFTALLAEVVNSGVSQNDTPRWLIKKFS